MSNNIEFKISPHVVEQSKEWMKNFCEDELNQSVEDIFEVVEEFIEDGPLTIFNYDANYSHEFWYHYEIITGKNVADSKKGQFFSCSC